ncbi:MAG: glycosyltransferase [Gemmatimonadota bacterium]|nr:glycosyltransferase [Gemmatimonadota bacterium]
MPTPPLADLPTPRGGTGRWPWAAETTPASGGDPAAWPRITVVTPSFNQGAFIEETIRSVLLQGYPNLEFIVADGGSQDSTVEILRRYDPWLAHWVSEPDRGQTHAINKGLARATGNIFTYLNSDDLLAPGALVEVAGAFRDHPEADVVYGACVYTDEEGNDLFVRRGRVSGFVDYLRIWEGFRRGEYLTQPEVFCRTRALVDAGGFREELHSVMDFDMWLRLLAAGATFHRVEAVLARFRTLEGQKSAVDPGDELYQLIRGYLEDPASPVPAADRPKVAAELQVARAEWLLRASLAAAYARKWPRWARYCARAVRISPRVVSTYHFWSILAEPGKALLPLAIRRRVGQGLRGA